MASKQQMEKMAERQNYRNLWHTDLMHAISADCPCKNKCRSGVWFQIKWIIYFPFILCFWFGFQENERNRRKCNAARIEGKWIQNFVRVTYLLTLFPLFHSEQGYLFFSIGFLLYFMLIVLLWEMRILSDLRMFFISLFRFVFLLICFCYNQRLVP